MSQDNKYDQPIAGHDYDGIQEFDNPLPMWWLWTFFGTIVFAAIYFVQYEYGMKPTSDQELAADLAKVEALKASAPKKELSDADFAAVLADPNQVSAGQVVYVAKCLACHADKGQGLVGPNLTDKFWIHGAKPSEMATIIHKGVLDKGMPPWEGVLKDEEITSVVAYIYSLKGTNPAGAKEPQGTEYPEYY